MSVKYIAPIALLLASCSTAEAPPGPAAPEPSVWASECKEDAGWDDPGPPFRIHGDTYYVGTCGIAAILIAGDDGHVLIDGGTEAGGKLIVRNIETLGFAPRDVKLLLHSHEHFDHVAGLAYIQQQSGARLLASREAATALRTGETQEGDPQLGILDPFPALRVDGEIIPAETVRLGNLALIPVATPGHTPGALSWQWTACDGSDCRTVVYADSLSAISSDDYRFSDHPAYVAAFRAALDRVAGLDCDILITPHPSASGLHRRAAADALESSSACSDYATQQSERLDRRLAEEGKQ